MKTICYDMYTSNKYVGTLYPDKNKEVYVNRVGSLLHIKTKEIGMFVEKICSNIISY